jgi:hypothetical protein
MEDATSRYGGVAANILNKQMWTVYKGDPSGWRLGERLTTIHCVYIYIYIYIYI